MRTFTTTPAELAEALPRLLGYVPHSSLIVANMPGADTPAAHGSVSVMRLDLPTTTAGVEEVMAALAGTCLQRDHESFAGWQDVMLLVWDEDGARNEHTLAALRRVIQATRQQDAPALTVRAVLTVTADTVLGHLHTAEGQTVPVRHPRGGRTSALESHLVLRGLQALPDRDAVAATVAAGKDTRTLPAVDVDEDALALVWRRAATADDSLTTEQAALLVNGLSNLHLRDQALTSITAFFASRAEIAPLGGQVLTDPQLAHLLDNLTRCCRAYADAAALADLLALTCFTAWMLGQGTVAAVALERSRRVNPGHRLSRLLDAAMVRGIRPPR